MALNNTATNNNNLICIDFGDFEISKSFKVDPVNNDQYFNKNSHIGCNFADKVSYDKAIQTGPQKKHSWSKRFLSPFKKRKTSHEECLKVTFF